MNKLILTFLFLSSATAAFSDTYSTSSVGNSASGAGGTIVNTPGVGTTATLGTAGGADTFTISDQPPTMQSGNGTLDLGSLSVSFSGNSNPGATFNFTLRPTFTIPSGFTGSSFTAEVNAIFDTSATVTFNQQFITFGDGNPADNFEVELTSTTFTATPGSPVEITANIVPEPRTAGALATGLVFLGFLSARRRLCTKSSPATWIRTL